SLRDEMEAGNVKILTSAKVDEITDDGFIITGGSGNKTLHEVDSVIVALALAPPVSNLGEELAGKVKEVYTIGDARAFRQMREIISEGYVTAYSL
ncbi:NADH:flavin oxidoreductase, partial [Chloroflexota bacterium]